MNTPAGVFRGVWLVAGGVVEPTAGRLLLGFAKTKGKEARDGEEDCRRLGRGSKSEAGAAALDEALSALSNEMAASLSFSFRASAAQGQSGMVWSSRRRK